MREYYSAPILIDISLTKKCNLHCDYCSALASSDYDDSQELTVEEYKNIFDQIDKMHVHRISLGGGEPFVRKDFFDILELATQHKFATVINTNATLIDEEVALKLAKYNFSRICVTLDGSRKETHEKHRGKNTFEKVIKGINILKKYELPVSTLFTLNSDNADDLINTIKLNEKLGMKYMTAMVVCPTGRASGGDLLLDQEKWYPLFMKLTEMKKNNEIKLNFKIVPPNESSVFWTFYYPLEYYGKTELLYLWKQNENVFPENREISCQAGVKALSIDQNGDIYGCDLMMGIPEFVAGNLRENTIQEIWNNSSVFKKFREFDFRNIKGKCSECGKKWCGGGCRSAAYNLTGSYYGSDESCFWRKK